MNVPGQRRPRGQLRRQRGLQTPEELSQDQRHLCARPGPLRRARGPRHCPTWGLAPANTGEPSQVPPLGRADGPPGSRGPATSPQGPGRRVGLCPALRPCPGPCPWCPHRGTSVHSRCGLSSLWVTFPSDLAGPRGSEGSSTPWPGVSPLAAGSGEHSGPGRRRLRPAPWTTRGLTLAQALPLAGRTRSPPPPGK